MKEIDRRVFASLNVDEYGIYYILVDGYFHSKFMAESDNKAIEIFNNTKL